MTIDHTAPPFGGAEGRERVPAVEHARALADAVLVEGYALYPYRASAPKNRFRWTFGVLAPRAWSEAGGCEPWWLESQFLVAGSGAIRLGGMLRFFQVERRRVERVDLDGFEPVESLQLGDRLVVGWDEGALCEVDLDVGLGGTFASTFSIAGGSDTEALAATGRLVRERQRLDGRIAIRTDAITAEKQLSRVTIRIENTTPWTDLAAVRDQAMTAAFASTHLLVELRGGELVSLLDPPAWAAAAAASCKSVHTYPVLAGPPGATNVLLSAPFILYDHPYVAPESTGDFHDACEIDELLQLRTMTLTDDEKREARATDPRTAAILDRVDALPDEWMSRLHGAARDVRDAEMVPRQPVFAIGSHVRLRPGPHTDAQDLLYAGKLATVAAIRHDVDGRDFLAVTIDDDPAAELHEWYGRFHYYRLDEVELVSPP